MVRIRMFVRQRRMQLLAKLAVGATFLVLAGCEKPGTEAPSVSEAADGFGRCCTPDDECSVAGAASRAEFASQCEAQGGTLDKWCPGDNKAVEVGGDDFTCSDSNVN